ncbi:hypothetical protein GSI_05403 [Ganoderma sinense ZZ0214-1]|uniref:Uncharacterized protein n=1 Tax=Ganoderma sinense ZZ0214-1 TaxID=1077348 RepID=A0A2G8SGJ5_9APHY|nr:hypothetical protein GSI_05403 [Ganoderma sinense ZZ0214-1]
MTLCRAPVLDAKGKGHAAVLEEIVDKSNNELPELVDVAGSSDEDKGGCASAALVQALTDLARQQCAM